MKKLKIITLLFLTLSFVGYSQITNTNVSDNTALALQGITGGNNNGGNGVYGTPMRFINPPRTVDGSIYLFNNWKNYPVVVKSKVVGSANYLTAGYHIYSISSQAR